MGAYGKSGDGGICPSSKVSKAFEKNKFNVPNGRALPGTNEILPYAMIRDEAFPLKSYILRPYPGIQIHRDETKKIFNERLSRARKVVEDAFVQLSQKFRVYQRRLKSLPEIADNIH